MNDGRHSGNEGEALEGAKVQKEERRERRRVFRSYEQFRDLRAENSGWGEVGGSIMTRDEARSQG